MPELPEVETTLRGVAPHLDGRRITSVRVRDARLRQPVPESLAGIRGCRVAALQRRAKYIVVRLEPAGSLLIHLGMSGSLRIAGSDIPLRRHDHVQLGIGGRRELRYHDPRRFGLFLHLTDGDPLDHPLLAGLGPEPLSPGFGGDRLRERCRGRRASVKTVIMDASTVVGVGNIYASEALFRAGIRPGTAARRVSGPRLDRLADAIKAVLGEAIESGGTTLRDFLDADGNPGYFRQRLFVYERAGEPCRVCGATIRKRVLAQRSTYWCPQCQK